MHPRRTLGAHCFLSRVGCSVALHWQQERGTNKIIFDDEKIFKYAKKHTKCVGRNGPSYNGQLCLESLADLLASARPKVQATRWCEGLENTVMGIQSKSFRFVREGCWRAFQGPMQSRLRLHLKLSRGPLLLQSTAKRWKTANNANDIRQRKNKIIAVSCKNRSSKALTGVKAVRSQAFQFIRAQVLLAL